MAMVPLCSCRCVACQWKSRWQWAEGGNCDISWWIFDVCNSYYRCVKLLTMCWLSQDVQHIFVDVSSFIIKCRTSAFGECVTLRISSWYGTPLPKLEIHKIPILCSLRYFISLCFLCSMFIFLYICHCWLEGAWWRSLAQLFVWEMFW